MKAKKFIIEKMVKAGKKHRWMKYPMLALVSLVSLFFLLVERCMEKPKRAVIALVCLVLIISQNWYLISVAAEDGEEDAFLNGTGFQAGEEMVLVVASGEEGSSSEATPVIYNAGATISTSQFDSSTCKVTYDLDGGTAPAGFDYQVYVDITNGSASMVLTDPGITKTGYTFTSWKINGSDRKTVGSEYVFSSDITLTPDWQVNTYYIVFVDENGASGTMDTVSVAYDATFTLPTCGFTKEGYSFAGWQDAAGNSYGDAASVKNLTSDNGAEIKLYANWIYNSGGFDRDTLEYEYSDTPNNDIINVYHEFVGDGSFDINLIAVQFDEKDINLSEYQDITGLTVTTGVNTIAFSGVVATVGTARFGFSIKDTVNTGEEIINKWVTVNLLQKKLQVIDITTKTKNYDGDSGISIGTISYGYAGTNEAITISGLYVTNASQQGNFVDKNGTFISDVGTDLNIYISGICLNNTDAGTDIAKYYSIDSTTTLEGIGTINPARLIATPVAKYNDHDGFIYTGEAAVFDVEVVAEDSGFLLEVLTADLGSIKLAIAGNYICEYSQSNYSYEDDHEYSVSIDIDTVNSNLKNYTISLGTGKLVVKHPVIEDSYYRIAGDQLEDSVWYYNKDLLDSSAAGATIYAMDETFDRIRITNDPYDRAYTCTDSAFAASTLITEDKATTDTRTLYIQMGSSATKAVTPIKKIAVYVDTTAPEIADTIGGDDGIQITTVSGSLGNFFKYGIFFKEKMFITVPVTDNLSGTDTLTYYLEDSASGTVTEGEKSIKNGTAQFEISPNFKGTITLSARDIAGNRGGSIVLGVDNTSLWVIEDTRPKITVTPRDSEGNTVYSGDDAYYKSAAVTVGVLDEDAGIQYIEWNITQNGELIVENEKEYLPESYDGELVTEYDKFIKTFTENGKYELTVTAYDNAGNASMDMEPIIFVIDGTNPVITILTEDYDAAWATEKTVEFMVTDSESGVNLLTLKNPDGTILDLFTVDGEEDTYTFTVTQKGTYTISAVDRAGNQIDYPLAFEKVSAEVPENPMVTISPEKPDDTEVYWYSENPTITITEPATTPDGTEIFTYYRLWKDGTDEPANDYTRVTTSFQLPGEGAWNLRVWAETESGVRNEYESEEDGLYQICYDGTAPVISDVSVIGSGTASRINLKILEATSGLAKLEVVYNNNEDLTQSLSFKYAGNGVYTAGFTAAMQGSYGIKATDLAGNTDVADTFEPMSIRVTGITGNAENGFTVVGRVTAGTYEIDSVEVTYGLENQKLTTDADECIIVTDEDGNKSFTAKFTQLSENTRYQFKITAISTNGEVCSYTGAIKTGISDSVGVNIAGTVIDETLSEDDTSTISVMLCEGNAVLQSRTVENGGTFIFTNVPDGIYIIRAVNGNRVAIQGVVISGNVIYEPTNAIELVLREGQSVSVEYSDNESSQIIVSGLENIFNDTTNFGSNQDNEIISAGGTVEFCMVVTVLSESEVPDSDLTAIRNNMRKNEVVAMYTDFSIWKRSYGAYGLISEQQVTSIAGGKTVRIVILLSSDLAAQDGLSVIRVHGNTVERLVDVDNNPNTYTFESALFSTYALVYTDNSIVDDTTDSGNGTDNTSNNGNSGTNGTSSGTDNTSNNGNSGTNGTSSGAGSTSDITKTTNTSANVTESSSGGSSVSPTTGDEAPIVLISILSIIMGLAGVLLIKKNIKHS